jgi:uncharacterized protein YigE (DUF2233 family)
MSRDCSLKPNIVRKHCKIYQLIVVCLLHTCSLSCSAQSKSDESCDSIEISIQELFNQLSSNATKNDSLRLRGELISKKIERIKSQSDTLSLKNIISLENESRVLDSLRKSIDQKIVSLHEVLVDRSIELSGAYMVSFKGVQYQVFIQGDSAHQLEIHHKDEKGSKYLSLNKVRKKLIEQGRTPIFLTNGGMYTPENNPEGLYVEEYNELFPLDTDSSKVLLNFYMHPNGVFYVDERNQSFICKTSDYIEKQKDSLFKPRLATQSGPMLKIDGQIHPNFNWGSKSRKIRSGVGTFQNINVFAITRGLTNFYDFATFYTEVIPCNNALFLDGTISLMYHEKLSPKDLGGNFGVILSVSFPEDAN